MLKSIREAVPSKWPAEVAELRRIAQGRKAVTLAEYLEESSSDLDDVGRNSRSWSDLRAEREACLLAGAHRNGRDEAVSRRPRALTLRHAGESPDAPSQ